MYRKTDMNSREEKDKTTSHVIKTWCNLMSLPSNLDVPMIFQENDFSCTPVCIKMVLEFIYKEHQEGSFPNMNVEEICNAMGTDLLGTPLENVDNINKKLDKAVPSIEFKAEMNCTFEEIENEILQGKPVIAWLKIPYSHSVVVTGLDKERLRIYCNDPEKGKRQMEMGKFISAWIDNYSVLIKVRIGEKIQRKIPEYIEKNRQEGEKL
jgi:ABC-type bacteriocin/lantibiotic exporter with double-glycine peptidase domain